MGVGGGSSVKIPQKVWYHIFEEPLNLFKANIMILVLIQFEIGCNKNIPLLKIKYV